MKNKLYMKEFEYFDGESFVKFNIVDMKDKTVTVAVTNQGKISYLDYDIMKDEKGLYFEYGRSYARINIEDFEEVE